MKYDGDEDDVEIEDEIARANTPLKKIDLVNLLYRGNHLNHGEYMRCMHNIQIKNPFLNVILRKGLYNRIHKITVPKSIPVLKYKSVSNFDAIVFIRGHSTILSHDQLLTLHNVETTTMLVTDPGEGAKSFRGINTEIMEYAHSANVINKTTGEILCDVKQRLRTIPVPDDRIAEYHAYCERPGMISKYNHRFYQREWKFFDTNQGINTKRGFIIILFGDSSVECPFDEDINTASHKLTKSQLLEDVQDLIVMKRLDSAIDETDDPVAISDKCKIGIVDFGCARWGISTSLIKKRNILRGTAFGGKTKKRILKKTLRKKYKKR